VINLTPLALCIPEILALKRGVAESAAKAQKNKVRKNSNILQGFISSRNYLNFTTTVGASNGYKEPYKFFLQNARNSFA